MESAVSAGDVVVVHDSLPFRILIRTWWLGSLAAVVAASARGGLVVKVGAGAFGVFVCAALVAADLRNPDVRAFADPEGISGIRMRVPRGERAGFFSGRSVVAPMIPWDQIGRISVETPTLSLSTVCVHLTDGRTGRIPADAVTKRGLEKVVAKLASARARSS